MKSAAPMRRKAPRLPAVCVGCGRRGMMAGEIKPRWCTCKGKHGPYQAPPGHVTCFLFGTAAEIAAVNAADERAKAIKDAFIDARDSAWTPSGRHRSPRSYQAWLARFIAARDALYALQAACDHPVRYRGCCVRCADERHFGSHLDVVAGRLAA